MYVLLKKISKTRVLYQCDWCGKEFEGPLRNSLTNGCNRSCGSKAARRTVTANLIAKYGVVNVGQLQSTREKVRQTTIERFGTECTFQAESVKEKIRDSVRERYGVDCASQATDVKQRVKDTNLKRYGVEYLWQSSHGREKFEKTMIERHGVVNPKQSTKIQEEMRLRHVEKYGVDNPLQRKEVIDKIKATNLENYGVEWSSQRDDVQAKIRQTCIERYGVSHVMQNPEIARKVYMSCLVKGKGFVSKDELRCFDILQSLFGEVVHQISVNKWLIDFYVKSIDTYVQFDGVYWHGLNRSEELLKNPVTKRDRDISRKWHRDREQEKWFSEQGKRLVRISDEQFNSFDERQLYEFFQI